MGRGRLFYALLACPVVTALGCQAIADKFPSAPTASPTPALTPLAIPVIYPRASPTPTPSPSPSPSPSPTPTPTPSPTPTPAASCALPPSNPSNPYCTDDAAELFTQVDTAITQTIQSHPEYFNLNDKVCDNCFRVVNVGGYIGEVLSRLAGMGLCAIGDAEEIGVKESNAYSEQYDILTSANYTRRGMGSYRGVCRPAIF